MPKVKLGEPDPREVELKAVIAANCARQGIRSDEELAKKVGINPSTYRDHMKHMDRLHISELWEILDTLKVPDEERVKLIKGVKK